MINYFDLGLYQGKELDMFLALNLECTVYGFEAQPLYANALQYKYADNDSIHIYNYAVSDANGKEKLYLCEGQGSSIFASKNNVSKEYIEVESVLFSDWIKGVEYKDCFNILRFNIEGAELHLMRDILRSGLYKDFDLFLGAEVGADIKKCSEIAGDYEEYIEMLEVYNIQILPYCHNLENNVDLNKILKNIK